MSGVFWSWGPYGWGVYRVERSGGETRFEASTAAPEGILSPGFVDIHIHGGFGIDFMSADGAAMATLCSRLADNGYEAYLPTTVTASPDAVRQAASRLGDDPMVQGFHLEGPFISPKHPGAQPPEWIVPPPAGPSDWDEVLDHTRLRLVTLAPETPCGLDLVERLARRGVVASLGHTDATFEQATEAAERGADHATHTFNAMRPFHHREPGTVGWALQDDRAYAELVYDRIHVSRAAASLLLRCKPKDKVVAVSDGTMASGLPAGTKLDMWGRACVVDGHSVRLAENGALAGSAVTLLEVFQNLAADFGPEVAVRACAITPRARLGMTLRPRRYVRFSLSDQIKDIWEC